MDQGEAELACRNRIGLEKESLRVRADGAIAQTPHPSALGSSLTHPYITTDYSEALLELITPPGDDSAETLQFLCDTHRFVYGHLGDEFLWATSMPCVLSGEASIPIAEYGKSNAGRMKHIYRRGLGYRYGRVMQVIAGVHFNFSMRDAFWPMFRTLEGVDETVGQADFVSATYMGMLRNLQRFGWLMPYLFGASPAVCASFFKGRDTRLPRFDQHTHYEPYATSLRMGDIGYTNAKEGESGVKVCYDSLDSYIDSLERAIRTPSARYAEIGVKVDGEYRQLNSNILQIENEYYSSVRPKQLLEGGERPSLALRRRGVRYIELRSLDVNAYHPLGVSPEQMRFIEAFLIFALFCDSPLVGRDERRGIDENFLRVAHRGREPGLSLLREGRECDMRAWALELLDMMAAFCELLDGGSGGIYCQALERQRAKVLDPEETPSARMLREMRERGEGFHAFALRMSESHRDFFLEESLPVARQAFFERLAVESRRSQTALEAGERETLDEYIAAYFANS
ncbi:glutamate--cysteine ligase [Acidihalobacter prosperus]|nr:glutamate--cysteine ligase [Acidihalobacter prosperus]